MFIAPLLEDLYFRYHQNRKYLSILLTFIVTAFTIVGINYLFIAYAIYLIVLLGLKLAKKEIPIPLMVYFVSGFFAFVHLTNYLGINWWANFY